MPPRDAIDRMRAEYPGRDDEWWRRQFRRFTNHFRAEPGARGRKSDWTRTWENWIHKAVELEPARRGSTGRQSPGEAVAQGLDLVARLEAQEAAQLTDQPAITGGAG